MMALVPELQIHLWNWRISKRFGTSSSRFGYGNGRLRTETLEIFSKFRKKSVILAPLKLPLIRLIFCFTCLAIVCSNFFLYNSSRQTFFASFAELGPLLTPCFVVQLPHVPSPTVWLFSVSLLLHFYFCFFRVYIRSIYYLGAPQWCFWFNFKGVLKI